MNKRLFTDTDREIPEASYIRLEFRQAIIELVRKYSDEYSVRDLHYLLNFELDREMQGQVLVKQYKLDKAKKSNIVK